MDMNKLFTYGAAVYLVVIMVSMVSMFALKGDVQMYVMVATGVILLAVALVMLYEYRKLKSDDDDGKGKDW
ncbi:MAG: hypothetical protein MJZ68_05495 [archaeon]|nr:hypothetical protein [archaeon]